MAPSHYEVLGVEEQADPDAVRRAYVELARRLHPDRWIDASPDERQDAERRMREVNEAWRVLGNPGRRLAYDSGRRRSGATAERDRDGTASGWAPASAFSSGDLFVDDAPVDLLTRLLRALPWAAVLLTLGLIFVFTAYATSDDGPPTECVRLDAGTATVVDCDAGGAREVARHVPDVGSCPTGTEQFQPADSPEALCLRP